MTRICLSFVIGSFGILTGQLSRLRILHCISLMFNLVSNAEHLFLGYFIL